MGPAGPLSPPTLGLELDPDRVSVCRLPPGAPWPTPPPGAELYSATRTPDELSVVCHEGDEPPGSQVEPGWRALRVVGPLAFDLIGVIASLAVPLADGAIGVFVVSTFDTDLVLVQDADLAAAVEVLRSAGHHLLPASD